MKRIEAVMKVFKINEDYYDLLSPFYDDGLTGIYEIFVCLGEVRDCAFKFVNPDLFGKGGEYISENLEGVFKDEERYNELRNYILDNQPELNEEMDKEDILTLAMELAEVEAERFSVYQEWSSKGISFDVFEECYIENLIEELMGEKLGDLIWMYSAGDLEEDELRADLEARLSEKSL